MALSNLTIQARAHKNAGPKLTDTFKGDGSTVYKRGMLLKKTVSGTVAPATADHASAGIHCFYSGPDKTAATSDFVEVTEITDDTRFLCQVHHDTEASAVAAQANIGDRHAIVLSGAIWGVDIETSVSNAYDVEITNIWDNLFPQSSGADESGVYGLVEVKVSPTRITNAPA